MDAGRSPGSPSALEAKAAWVLVLIVAASLAACATRQPPSPIPQTRAGGTMAPYEVNGVWYRPRAQPDYDEVGIATWYGAQYHNRQTADGEIFDMDRASAAHATLPLPCIVEVINLDNGRRIRVRVNDRGPFVRGRILDLSREAARELGFYEIGSARVRVRYVGPAPAMGGGGVQTAAFVPPSSPSPPVLQPSPASAKVQAGAFAERANAERAAAMVAGAGGVSIEPLDHGGGRLWRVVVSGAAGESAQALRDQVTASGFPGARIVEAAPEP